MLLIKFVAFTLSLCISYSKFWRIAKFVIAFLEPVYKQLNIMCIALSKLQRYKSQDEEDVPEDTPYSVVQCPYAVNSTDLYTGSGQFGRI